MKRIVISSVLIFSLACLFTSCGSKALTGKPGSSGKTLELLLVAKKSVNTGTTEAVIDSIFKTPQVGLNQPEPRFDVVRISPNDFEGNSMFQAHRNILVLEVDPLGLNKIFLEYDPWSTPQVAIRVTANSRESLDSMLLANEERLLKEYYKQEYRRMDKIFSATPGIKIINKIKEKYGFALSIPEEFALAKMKEETDFTWVLKNTKDFDLHLYIYKQAPKDESDFEEAKILDNIDTLLKRYVPGPSEGSYPGVERRDFFYTREVMLGDVKAVETRGLWRTYNDFMGGPFISFRFLSPDKTQLYTMICCVYSPSQRNKLSMKRDLLMQLDGICHSIKFE